jgi:hypothetical protein
MTSVTLSPLLFIDSLLALAFIVASKTAFKNASDLRATRSRN